MTQKHWREVKEEIENEIDRIWWEEPKEIKMSRLGVYPSGAGTDQQTLGNLFFLLSDTRSMGFWTVIPTIQRVIEDSTFTLEHCKRIWKYNNLHMATFLGGTSSKSSQPYLNLAKLYQFCLEIISTFDTISTKKEFESLVWSWGNYVNALHKWLLIGFPWDIGRLFPRREISDVEQLANFSGLKITRDVINNGAKN
jgi:hypothetical protein